jgi:hypothetical protein
VSVCHRATAPLSATRRPNKSDHGRRTEREGPQTAGSGARGAGTHQVAVCYLGRTGEDASVRLHLRTGNAVSVLRGGPQSRAGNGRNAIGGRRHCSVRLQSSGSWEDSNGPLTRLSFWLGRTTLTSGSWELPPSVSTWKLTSKLLGRRRLECRLASAEGREVGPMTMAVVAIQHLQAFCGRLERVLAGGTQERRPR